ncbi:MAG TPA: hypothetical protein VF526_20315 [Solirubrobacteraceae bacterium]|jgi:hypothetical protein
MAGPLRVRVAILALSVAGCSSESEPVPRACASDPAAIVEALASAPATVTLQDGTRISTCVSRASSPEELQALAVSLTRVADDLGARVEQDFGAATALGYLAGAVQRGAASSQDGVAAQLSARIERAAGRLGGVPAAAVAMQRGLQAGRRSG